MGEECIPLRCRFQSASHSTTVTEACSVLEMMCSNDKPFMNAARSITKPAALSELCEALVGGLSHERWVAAC